ncbi:Protein of unknown function [Cnuella takakiae]|uniref:DUF2892 domain-containing protein n=1 Tax=Cnuella takakiae TaxID=1302690 RepID=A0A1M4V2V4_9BACT|nr:DUF2892 domain-containing protein [Cnuella takakiae]OLY92724.1 hypothetical protein BUE76_13110 [Cnuella takakiae]SHE63321.1 Protein of unknown function [Cnuella takakiae]
MNQPKMDARISQADGGIDKPADQETYRQLKLAANNPHRINQRLAELEGSWNLEKALALNAATLALTGIVLGLTVSRKWLILPAAVSLLLAQNAIQGWCPPIRLLSRLGFRTRTDIDRERLGLKMLRGDLGAKMQDGEQVWQAVKNL